MKKVFPAGKQLVTEALKVTDLVIETGAVLEAPEGKFLTLIVDGVGRPVAPGTYHGEVELALADLKVETTYPSVRRRNPIPLKTAVTVDDGKADVRVPGMIRGGKITDTSAEDFYFATSDTDYAAIVVDGEGDYTVNNARIVLDGEGNNDFVGMGAGVAAIGNANVTINNSEISLSSVTRCAVHVGGTGTVTVNDSKLMNLSPQVEMGSWSWGIAIRGTNRLCQLADDGTVYYNNCLMRSNGWGILSVDGSNYAHMHVKDCDMELEGAHAHGYGVFCIGPTDIHLDNTRLNVNGFPVLLRGMERKGVMDILNGTKITGRRFGLHSQGDTGSVVTIKDSSIVTDKATFLIKGSTGTRYDIENAVFEPGDGNILQLIDSDDPGLSGTFVDVSMYDQADIYIPGRNLTDADPENDITMNITGCNLKGNFLNSTSDLVNKASKEAPKELVIRDAVAPGELGNEGKVSGGPPPAGMPGGPGGMPGGPGGPGGMFNEPPKDYPTDACYFDATNVALKGDMFNGTGYYGQDAKKLVVRLGAGAQLDGAVSATETIHVNEKGEQNTHFTIKEFYYLGHVANRNFFNGDNFVEVELADGAVWNVTGEGVITALTVGEGCTFNGKAYMDGQELAIEPGKKYEGVITVK